MLAFLEDRYVSCRSEDVDIDVDFLVKAIKFLPIGDHRRRCKRSQRIDMVLYTIFKQLCSLKEKSGLYAAGWAMRQSTGEAESDQV